MSTALRTFIKETLAINEIGGSMGQDMRYAPRSLNAQGGAARDQLLHPKSSDRLEGRLYSTARGGEPDFIVIADNSATSQCIIAIYSKAETSKDTIASRLGARPLDVAASGISRVLTQKKGWSLTVTTHERLQAAVQLARAQAAAAAASGGATDDQPESDFLLTRRDLSKFFLPPVLATPEGRDKAIAFECVMTRSDAIATVMNVADYGSKDWFMAAACFYSYANGVSSAVFCALVGAALSAAGFGPAAVVPGVGWAAAGGAVLAGAAMGAAFCDVVLRVPVLYWSAMNGKKTFAAANFAYMLISIAFQSVQAFKAAKAAPTSLRVSAVEFLLQLTTSVITELNLPLGDEESVGKIREFLENPDMIKPALTDSEAELIQAIRDQYPES